MDKSSMSVGSIVGLCFVIVVLCFGMQAIGNNSKLQMGVHYLQTGQTSLNYHQLARQDATNEGISADIFEKQI